ncbi:MAG: DUF3592 domain-containing protein [Phycisphaerae bacterium]|nr:DUF3592 domain-containing protein [Phycisphaerae bacterium]
MKSKTKSHSGYTGSKLDLTGFHLMFLLFSLALTSIIGLSFIKIFKTYFWEKTHCTILSCKIDHAYKTESSYGIDISYTYTFNGQSYTSDIYQHNYQGSSDYTEIKQIVDQIINNTQVNCYVNPECPQEAYLTRESLWRDGSAILVCQIFTAIGVGGIVFTWRKKNPKKNESNKPKPKSALVTKWYMKPLKISSQHQDFSLNNKRPDSIILKSDSSAIKNLLGGIFATLFWNGIVSVFLSLVLDSFEKGEPNWVLTIFIIPFVLVGLYLILVTFYHFLKLFNARPILTLTPGVTPLGTTTELSWTFRGWMKFIRHLTITLSAREEATYDQGSSSKTDKHTFYEMELFSTNITSEMTAGKVKCAIPQDCMHSFQAKHNKIIWSINVKGNIKLWPNISSKFPFTVLPTDPSDDQ